jgi:hypothetical protein
MLDAELIRVWTDEDARDGRGTAGHPAGDLDAELAQLLELGPGETEDPVATYPTLCGFPTGICLCHTLHCG